MTDYTISAPALHAARTILRHFNVREKSESKYEFTEANLAKLIDAHTHAWRIKQAVKEITSRVNWVPNTSNDVEHNLDLLRDAVMSLQMIDRRLPRYEDEKEPTDFLDANHERHKQEAKRRAAHYEVSAVSVLAIRAIQEHYEFIERPDGQMDSNEANLAGIIDVCTQIFRVQDALHRMCAMVRTMGKQELEQNMKTVRNTLAALDIACAFMPGYGEPRRTLRVVQDRAMVPEITLSHEQKRQRAQVLTALHRTRNPADAMQVINAARADRMI